MAGSSPRVLAAVVALAAAVLTSCGQSPSQPPAGRAPSGSSAATGQPAGHNAADVDFARNMIPHHQQAVVLAAMVPDHTANPELRVMATHIGADQQAEIRTLDGLLAEWLEPAGANGAMAMAGMVDQSTIDRMRSLDDGAFDTLWVTSMIGHHQGAITMAQNEIARGQSTDAIRAATLIVTAQQREIAMMTHLISAAQ